MNADAITIRNLDPGDEAQWAALYRRYAAFYEVDIDDAALRRTWSWLMRPEHPEEEPQEIGNQAALLVCVVVHGSRSIVADTT